jgi:transcriptional regulator with XRE-family HTH domain
VQPKADPSVRRAELRSLLIACRARRRPADVGLPESSGRRLPGLRQEEVAELVGVSARWYASFEAGTSDHHFSTAFLQRVADVLLLDDSERVKLFTLTLPQAAEVAEQLNVAFADAEKSLREAQASAGRALASAVYRELIAQELVRKAEATTGRALANAIYYRLLADEPARETQQATDHRRRIVSRKRRVRGHF